MHALWLLRKITAYFTVKLMPRSLAIMRPVMNLQKRWSTYRIPVHYCILEAASFEEWGTIHMQIRGRIFWSLHCSLNSRLYFVVKLLAAAYYSGIQMKIWSSHLLDNLSNCLMNLKNSVDSTGFEPMTSAMPVQCSNQLSYEVTQWRAGQFVGLMFSRERSVIWKKCYKCEDHVFIWLQTPHCI